MVYEEFYGSDKYIDEKLDLTVGWTYFKDLRKKPLPIWNEKRDIYLIFSGQIFVSPDSLEWLKIRGHSFSNDDYNYIIHFYEEYGKNFFERLNGQFAGLLVDYQKRSIYLFNDRFGFGRIYYREINNNLFFSTEAKSLLRIFPDSREIDLTSLSQFLTCGCTLRGCCLFKNISILPPGSIWKFDHNNSVKKETYISKALVRKSESSNKEEYFQSLKQTIRTILPRYFNSPQNIGVSVTGGKDTRIILAYSDLSRGNVKCYTFGSIYRENRDEKLGVLIANILGLPFTAIKLGCEFFKLFPALSEKTIYVSDGTMDVSGAPSLYANRIARDISPIRITGNYGQEILEGSVAFKPSLICERFVNIDFNSLLRDSYNSYMEERASCDRCSFILSKQLPWHHYSRYKLESSQLNVYSPFLDNDIIKLVSEKSFCNEQSSDDLRMRLYADVNPILGRIETDRGYKYGILSLSDKINIFCQEFTFKAEYACDYGMPQLFSKIDYILRPLHLEKIFLGRHKYYHFRIWYRDVFANYIKEMLLDRKTLARHFIDANAVRRIVLNHTRGISNHTIEIHKLLTVELIYRKLIENWR